MEIQVRLSFDAAHRLPYLPEGHKCSNLHGHTFYVDFVISGNVMPRHGWVIDFADVKKIVNKYLNLLDHTYLNEIEGLENPTSENIAIWLWDKIRPELPGIIRVEVRETPTSAAIYTGV